MVAELPAARGQAGDSWLSEWGAWGRMRVRRGKLHCPSPTTNLVGVGKLRAGWTRSFRSSLGVHIVASDPIMLGVMR